MQFTVMVMSHARCFTAHSVYSYLLVVNIELCRWTLCIFLCHCLVIWKVMTSLLNQTLLLSYNIIILCIPSYVHYKQRRKSTNLDDYWKYIYTTVYIINCLLMLRDPQSRGISWESQVNNIHCYSGNGCMQCVMYFP